MICRSACIAVHKSANSNFEKSNKQKLPEMTPLHSQLGTLLHSQTAKETRARWIPAVLSLSILYFCARHGRPHLESGVVNFILSVPPFCVSAAAYYLCQEVTDCTEVINDSIESLSILKDNQNFAINIVQTGRIDKN